jgi:pyruvate,water dikinase
MSASLRGRKFEAPGPGAWELDQAHFTRPFTAFAQELLREPFMRGFAEGTRRYGLLLDTMEPGMVHGFAYMKARPVGAPSSATRPPPKLVFKLLVWLHPQVRQRLSAAKVAFEKKLWREDLRRWDEEVKPGSIRKHQALQATNPRALDTGALAEHLVACRNHLIDMIFQHHQYTVSCVLPTGDYLAHAREWTGLGVGELLAPLRGSSPVSNGVAAEELVELARAIADDAHAQKLVESARPATEVLAELRAIPGSVGERAARYLDLVSYRILGYDVADRAAIDVPEVLVKAIRVMLDPAAQRRGEHKAEQATAAVRDKVPGVHKNQFDELLGEARLINRLRDERGMYSDAWATGLARRAILAAGERVAESGRLDAPELLIDAKLDEMLKLLRGDGGPESSELRERAVWRTTVKPDDAPPWLGAPPSGPPPAEWLPAHGARAARAMDAVLGALFKDAERSSDARVIRGLPVSGGVYEGPARVIGSTEELGRLQQGDVLVTRTTSAYFNAVLPLLGAIVTERGGQLSHPAIVAREYGIPGVVGTKLATKSIPDGARVRVDGDAGEVILL